MAQIPWLEYVNIYYNFQMYIYTYSHILSLPFAAKQLLGIKTVYIFGIDGTQ